MSDYCKKFSCLSQESNRSWKFCKTKAGRM